MNIKHTHIVYFSPANHTERVCTHLQHIFPSPLLHNVTAHASTFQEDLSSQDFCIFAVPSFGGRIPAIALEKFQNVHGHQTPCLLVVTYGNRAYEDTLIELYDFTKHQGFVPVGAMAVICEHSIMHVYGAGRPDYEDQKQIDQYINRLLDQLIHDTVQEITVPGNHSYKELKTLPMTPKANKSCIQCGICATECPVEAIDSAHPEKTNKDKCISCMRCITVCPQHARALNPILIKGAAMKLKKACETRKENEFY